MSPGLRLIVAPAALLAGALLCFVLPRRRAALGRPVALTAAVGSAALLLSAVAPVREAGRLERGFGELVPGVSLTIRADAGGLAVSLLAAAIAVAALTRLRRPAARTGLLLCLAGTTFCALGGNVVLLYWGMELGTIGALILTGAERRPSRGRLAWFAVQHVAALGLLAAAVQLQTRLLTTDLAALPPEPVSGSIAVPWALAATVRLLAVAGAGGPMGAGGLWCAVAAVPSGLIVLLRLVEVHQSTLPQPVPALLLVIGSLALVGGGLVALRVAARATAAGRALAVGGAGLVLVAAGTAGGPGLTAACACGVALVLAVAAAEVLSDDAEAAPAWSRAAALAVAGCLPVGLGFSGVLLAGDAAVAGGLPGGVVAVVVAAGGGLLAVAAARAAAAVLSAAGPAGARAAPSVPALVGLAASGLGALLPGLALSLLIAPIAQVAGASPVAAVDALAVRGPGGGWGGGYLGVALLAVVAAVLAASSILRRPALAPPAPAAPPPPPPRWLSGLGSRTASIAGRGGGALAAADSWLVVQPGLALIALGAAVAIFSFR